jgi:mRNA-degrading endonuclease toxin of MazEF toxin-antitoxin module
VSLRVLGATDVAERSLEPWVAHELSTPPRSITSVRRDLPSHVEIEAGESGLDHPGYAKCEDVKSVSDRRLIDRLGVVGPEPLFAIERVLRYLFEM